MKIHFTTSDAHRAMALILGSSAIWTISEKMWGGFVLMMIGAFVAYLHSRQDDSEHIFDEMRRLELGSGGRRKFSSALGFFLFSVAVYAALIFFQVQFMELNQGFTPDIALIGALCLVGLIIFFGCIFFCYLFPLLFK